MKDRLIGILTHRRTRVVLVVLNVLAAWGIAWAVRHDAGGDARHYVALAEGLLHGRFSAVWQEADFVPDTLRTPGYPAYIAAVILLTGGWAALLPLQLLLYLLALWLALATIKRIGGDRLAGNIFLLLTLASFNIPFFIPKVSTEIPALAALGAALLIDPAWSRRTWWSSIALGLLYAFVFQCRPVFLLFPFVRIAVDMLLLRPRPPLWHGAIILGTFTVALLPFGFWNLKHHGAFRVTPIEGGGGVFHLGYWSGRIPGHQEHRYWAIVTAEEIISFVPRQQVPQEVERFEREWDEIDRQLTPYLSPRDSARLAERGRRGMTWNTYGTGYTRAREILLVDRTVQNIRAHPGYYAGYKLFSAVRLWVIGVQRDQLRGSWISTIGALLPFLVTLGIFLLAIIAVPWVYLRRSLTLRRTYPLLLLVLYFGLIHLPFVIQSRYTIPARFALAMLIALAIQALLMRRRTDARNGS